MEHLPDDLVYLNTAACGLLSPASLKAVNDFNDAMQFNGSTRSEHWRFNEFEGLRNAVASFLNAPAENIALLPNFSFAINSIVQALNGDEKVLLYKNDFPTLLEPFRINKFDITWIDAEDNFTIDGEEIKKLLLDKKIDILAISHVQWRSGYRLDIGDIGAFCREHDIIFIIDATQSLGAMAIDMNIQYADVLIASNYKWMNAGFGTGVMYMSGDFLVKYPPVIAGFGSYTIKNSNFVLEPSIRHYEPGHLNITGLLTLEVAIKEKQEKGMVTIEAHNTALTKRLLDGMSNFPVKLVGTANTTNRGSIVLIEDEQNLGKHLEHHHIIVSQRLGLLRISMHFYNTEADIDAFINCLRGFYVW